MALFFFAFLFIIGEMLPLIQTVYENDVSFSYIFLYFQYNIPYMIISYILPVSCLLAIFFSTGKMSKSRELIIYRTAGMSPVKIFLPIVIIIFFIFIIAFLMIITIIPDMVIKANEIKYYNIRKVPVQIEEYNNISVYLGNDNYLNAEKFLFEENRFKNVSLIKISENIVIEYRYDARELVYTNNNWYLINGTYRRFAFHDFDGVPDKIISVSQLEKIENFEARSIQITEKPDQILNLLRTDRKDPDEITMKELLELINMKRKARFDYTEDLISLFNKFTNGFRNLSLAAIGLPIALKTSNQSLSLGFGLSLIISFIYWIMTSIFSSLGNTQVLPPVVAAFVIDFLCVLLGFYFFNKVKEGFY